MKISENNCVGETVTPKKKCVVCKVEIKGKKECAKTCSLKCRLKLHRKTHVKRYDKCLFCGSKFTLQNTNKKFCGKKCEVAHWRLQNIKKTASIQRKFEILKKFGLVASNEPPKGGRINIELNEIKIQLHCTDLGGAIAKNPKQISEALDLQEIIFFCKHLAINPYKFCSKTEIIEFVLLSENYSIIESCINDIWKPYQAPTIDPAKETITAIIPYQDGIFAYKFWECREKSKLLDTLNKYRDFSKL
jgi:hypothetical protein